MVKSHSIRNVVYSIFFPKELLIHPFKKKDAILYESTCEIWEIQWKQLGSKEQRDSGDQGVSRSQPHRQNQCPFVSFCILKIKPIGVKASETRLAQVFQGREGRMAVTMMRSTELSSRRSQGSLEELHWFVITVIIRVSLWQNHTCRKS